MRFHIGFSKRISWKWILLILGGLAAFFGIGNHAVLAATTGTVSMNPSTVKVVDSYIGGSYTLPKTYRSGSSAGVLGNNYYSVMDYQAQGQGGVDASPILEGEVQYTYSAKNLCSSGQKVTFSYKYFVHSLPSTMFPNNNWVTPSGCQLNSRTLVSNSYYTVSMTCNNNIPITLKFGFFNDYNTNEYFASSAISEVWDYSCDYSLIDSTQDIINNSNSNTQQIIDSQQDINDSINNDNVQSGVSHGGNLFTNTNINDHGVSTIVTAPVRLLQGMLNSGSSCNDLIIFSSIFGQDKLVTMPSGCILWNRAPSSIVSIYHVVIFGLLGYYVLVDIWKTVTDVLDPERKNDYVMDL